MAGKKVGSDGQVRKTTTEWTADTATYPEGMRLMDTDTGSVRISKGTTYALAWQPATGGDGTTLDPDIVAALEADRTPAADAGNPFQTNADLVTLANSISTALGTVATNANTYADGKVADAINDGTTTVAPSQNAVFDALALKADASALPKRYQFTGDGGNTTGTIGVNTFPMAVTVTNPGAGDYHFTAASGTPFTAGKTAVGLAIIDGSNPLAWKIKNISSSEVEIEIYNTVDGANTDPQNYIVTIQTEP